MSASFDRLFGNERQPFANMGDPLGQDGRSEGMDAAKEDHKRYCRLVKGIVHIRMIGGKPPAGDWMCEAFQSAEAFHRYFPDPVQRRAWLADLEVEVKDTKATLESKLSQVLDDGFTYEDLEQQRYEFRAPRGA